MEYTFQCLFLMVSVKNIGCHFSLIVCISDQSVTQDLLQIQKHWWWIRGVRPWKEGNKISFTFISPPPAPRNTFWLTNRSLGYAPCISKSSAICKIRTLLFILPCSFSLMFRIGMEMSCYSLRIEWCKEVSATQTVGWQSNLGKSANSSFLITIHAAFLYRNNMHEDWKWIRESAYE